jgi:hypothetical protein
MSAQQLTLVSEAADVVAATPLSNGNIALTWQVFSSPTYVIRAIIAKPDCTPLTAAFTVSSSTASTGSLGAGRAHVAANGAALLFSWITDDDLWIRTSTLAGALGTEMKVILATQSQTIEHVRLVPFGSGFAAFIRWAARTSSEAGKLEMVPISSTGTVGAAVLVSDETNSDFASNKAFGVAALTGGSLVTTWHTCGAASGQCDVHVRILDTTGTPTGPATVLATTTVGDQVNPAVAALPAGYLAAWTDASAQAPDTSGTAVRARIIYLP